MEGSDHHEHHSHDHAHAHAWKWGVGILILLAVFAVGFMCGRVSALFGGWEYGYGYHMGPWMMYGNYGYPSGGYGGYVVPQGATTTPAPYYYPMGGMMGGYYYPSQATSTR